ncbi:MAG: hypothetical protein KJ799_10445 [Bacteroidetes bacterium]|nr:hypothetical protein [Bacteroidota bacterium]MBU1678071.1 hypothetical protein [Bacteroidota bacterium]MBU2507127.1 hypothetical protein [Bacteroidota bacterium]
MIPAIGQRQGIFVTQDNNINRNKFQFALCSKYNLGMFFLTLPKNQNKHWEIVKLLIINWVELVNKSQNDIKPFAYRIRVRGKMEKL